MINCQGTLVQQYIKYDPFRTIRLEQGHCKLLFMHTHRYDINFCSNEIRLF